jgi:NitT/TauT family transport system permease protein
VNELLERPPERAATTLTDAGNAPLDDGPRAFSGPRLRALQLGLLFAFLLLWEVGANVKIIDTFFFSKPTKVATTLGGWLSTPEFYWDVGITVFETAMGFAIGTLLGVALGFLFARNATVGAIFNPLIVMLNAIPRVLLFPLIVLWFGLKITGKIAFATILVFFIVFFATYTAIREVEGTFIENALILGARSRDLTRHVLLPSALTWIFSSLRTSVGFAFIGAVVAEYLSSSEGMGHRIQLAEAFYEVHGVYAGMFVILAIALVIDVVMQRVERRFSVWKPNRGV